MAQTPFEASGGSTVESGGNKYHVFTSSGSFVVVRHQTPVMLFTMPSSVAEVEQEINTLVVVVLVDLELIIQAAPLEIRHKF